jgi:hypothetical protein
MTELAEDVLTLRFNRFFDAKQLEDNSIGIRLISFLLRTAINSRADIK